MSEHHSKDRREEDEGGIAGRGAPAGGSASKSGSAGKSSGGTAGGGLARGGTGPGDTSGPGGMSKAGGVPGAGPSGGPTPDTPAPGQRTYTVRPGDNLSRIAKEIYGDASRWKDIYEANKSLIGTNPDLIKPGQVLTIP